MIAPYAICRGASRIRLLAVGLLVLSPGAWAQGQSLEAAHITPGSGTALAASTHEGAIAPALKPRPLRVDVNLVLVPVTVVDSFNRPVIDLPQQNFSLFEGGVPQKMEFFSCEDAPISVALVLDFSGSMANKTEYEREAVDQFFENANPEDDYTVITVSSRPELVAESSRSSDAIESKLAMVEPKGGTALYDAIYLGVAKLHSARYKRRAMVIVSDGGDNRSRYTLGEIKQVLAEADVLTYSIGIFDDVPVPLFKTIEERLGRKWLDDVTQVSGGRNIAADDRRKIPEIAALISSELRSQYILGYRPTNPNLDGKWRKITVKLSDTPAQMRAHYKQGYLALGQ